MIKYLNPFEITVPVATYNFSFHEGNNFRKVRYLCSDVDD